MQLPIDTSMLTLLCASEPEPVLDFQTKQPKATPDGEPLFSVQLILLNRGPAEVISVKVPGQPKGVKQGAPIQAVGLVAVPWVNRDRSGIAFRADPHRAGVRSCRQSRLKGKPMRLKWVIALIVVVAIAPEAVAAFCAEAVHVTVTAIDTMVDKNAGATSG